MTAMRMPTPAQRPLPLAGVVITRNEADRIARCVHSLAAVCAEVWVLDSGSTDATVEVARAAGAIVRQQEWLGFAAQKNAVIALATQPWVILLDADEWLADGAAERLRALFARDVESADVWELRRRTHYLGAVLRFGGWGNEKVKRLFRNDLRFKPGHVHEKMDVAGRRVRVSDVRMEHDTARNAAEYRAKLDRYAQLSAEQAHAQGRRATALAPALHAVAYVVKTVLLRGGFFDGPGAWRYHAEHVRYVWSKYERLRTWGNRSRAGKS
jgi:(heptosyl)LPS beta-1,4-glucosyltransferase